MRLVILSRICIVVLMFLVAIVGVSAVGISPAKVTGDYVAGYDVNIEYTVRGNSRSWSTIEMNLGGILAQYATLDKKSLEVSNGEVATFIVNIDVPEDHGLVGPQDLLVSAVEKPNEKSDGIVVATGVEAKVTIFFPYPGKYADITKLTVPHINEGENTKVEWIVKNRGFEAVEVSATLRVNNALNETILTKEYPSFVIQPEQEYSKTGLLETADYEPGVYGSNLSISYVGAEKSQKRLFNVGEEDVNLVSYGPPNLTSGEVNKIYLRFKSLWNTNFADVYATVDIPGSSTQTASFPLGSFQEKTVDQFLQVPQYGVGTVEANVSIFFNGNRKDFTIEYEVVEAFEDSQKLELNILTIAVIVLALILVALVLFIFIRRKK